MSDTPNTTVSTAILDMREDIGDIFYATMMEAERGKRQILDVGQVCRDNLAIGFAASALNWDADPAYKQTIDVAAKQLEQVVELNYRNMANHSQREFAGSLREDRERARKILHYVWEDEAIQKFWEERKHYHRPAELNLMEQRDLNRLVRVYFESLPTIAGMMEEMIANRNGRSR